MSWKNEIKELSIRSLLSKKLGGEDKILRQHKAGRMTILERINALLDKDSFEEIGGLAGKVKYDQNNSINKLTPSNSIIGQGYINNRPIVIYGDDFTVRGGASDASIHDKMIAAEKFANEYQLPLIRLIEGTGGGGSIKSLEMDNNTYVPFNPGWDLVIDNLSKIPVISLALGPVAGLGAARLVNSHLSIMVSKLSQVFVAGPPLVKHIGENVTKNELGGSDIHGRNGVVDNVVESEMSAFKSTSTFLSYMPSSAYKLPSKVVNQDPINRADKWLINAIPRNKKMSYDMSPIIESIVDKSSFFQIGGGYGRSMITGLARLDGYPIILLANNPQIYGGGWTADASYKIVRILDLAGTFHIPVLHLVDNPGFIIGTHAEKAGTIRAGSRALAAIYQLKVPMCTIIIRKAFGVAGAANINHAKYKYRYAWPSGDWGSLPTSGGIEAAYKTEISKSQNPEEFIKNKQNKLQEISSPFRSAEKFLIENIIDPRETRFKVCKWVKLSYPLLKTGIATFTYRP